MEHVEVEVILVTNKMDWATGQKKEEKILFKVDRDNISKLTNIKVIDMGKIERDKTKHNHKSSYSIHSIGWSNANGMGSLVNHILGLDPKSRRLKGTEPNDYTRAAYGIPEPEQNIALDRYVLAEATN